MDPQQQQTGVVNTGNPQTINQPSLGAGTTSLQPTSTNNVNQLRTSKLPVTATCGTICSGSIPAQSANASRQSGMSGTAWVIVIVGVVVAAGIAWMFRGLTTNSK